MQTGKVSVVMCTYNGQQFLKEQMDSILAQTYPLFEFLVFDDASTDSTIDILAAYCKNHPVIKIHANERNVGWAVNFKQALLAAKGEIIAIADQDDIWAKDKIERMLMKWNLPTLLIYCNSVRFAETPPQNPSSDPNYRRFEGTDVRKISLFNTVSGHAVLIKKELLPFTMPFPQTIFYDWWLAVVAACNGGVSFVDEILVYQRVHQQNVSINDGLDHTQPEQRNNYKKMVIKHLKHFENIHNLAESDKIFLARFAELLEKSLRVKFYLPLLLFMLQHKDTLFYHKKKKFFSYVKYACRLTYNYGH